MQRDFLKPIESAPQKVLGVSYTNELQRAQLLGSSGSKETFEEIMHDQVMIWLTDGFARPNGCLPWSLIFSNLSEDHYRSLFCIFADYVEEIFCEKRSWYDVAQSEFTLNKVKAKLFERAAFIAQVRGDLQGWPAAVKEYCKDLPIVDVGLSTSREYTSLGDACFKVLELQIGDKSRFSAMADPEKLKLHMHDYIDRLVFLSNEVQKFSGRVIRVPDQWDVDRAHNEILSDKEIETIANSSPAILFTQALGDGQPSRPVGWRNARV